MKTASERSSAYRRRIGESGRREIRLWVADTRLPERRSSLAAQGRAIAADVAEEADVLELIESWRDWDEAR
jgi:hypothetical protein